MVNFGDALRKGLKFSIEPKRWLPLFALDVSCLGIILLALLTGMGGMTDILLETQGDMAAPMPFTGYFLGFLALGTVWYILRIWIVGSIIHQSRRPKELEKGYVLSLKRLHKLITAAVAVALISGLTNMVPFAGWAIGLFVGWVLFFMFQGIIIDNLGVVSTFRNSWRMFRKSPFDVFIAWLLISMISMLIATLFALPFIIMFLGVFLNPVFASGGTDPSTVAFLIIYIQNNLAAVVSAGLVALVGLGLSQAFALKAQTEFYLQLKKRFPDILGAFRDMAGRFF